MKKLIVALLLLYTVTAYLAVNVVDRPWNPFYNGEQRHREPPLQAKASPKPNKTPRQKLTEDDISYRQIIRRKQKEEGREILSRGFIVLDLDEDGISYWPASNSPSAFDIDSDGFRERVQWPMNKDGILCRDIDHDGRITHFKDLQGCVWPQCITCADVLAKHDANRDGVFDASDPAWRQLRVWRGKNMPNKRHPEYDLFTLSDVNVTSIALNQGQEDCTMTFKDGTRGRAVFFVPEVNQRRSVFARDFVKDPEAYVLPDLHGYGNLPDLRVAMSLNPKLKEFVAQLVPRTTPQTIDANLEELILHWAATHDINPSLMRGDIAARKLATVEWFHGKTHIEWETNDRNAYGKTAAKFERAYDALLAHYVIFYGAQTLLDMDALGMRYERRDDTLCFATRHTELAGVLARNVAEMDDAHVAFLGRVLRHKRCHALSFSLDMIEGQISKEDLRLLVGDDPKAAAAMPHGHSVSFKPPPLEPPRLPGAPSPPADGPGFRTFNSIPPCGTPP